MLGSLSTAQPFEPLQRTEWQRRHFEQVSATARLASEKALPELLAALDSRALRERLAKQCAQLAANSSASELLRRLRAEYSTAEVVSSFDAESPSGGPFRKASWWSFTLADGMDGDELLNQWEVRVKHNESFDVGGWLGGWFQTQDDVETKLYGLRPFESHGAPRNNSEAAERSIYALLNLAGADGGSPLYGDISAVLSPRHVRSVTLLSAIDTGEWTALCNQTRGNTAEGIAAWREGTAPLPGVPWHGARREGVGWTPNPPPGWTPSSNYTPYAPVCDAYHFTLGTLDHFDHLILANLHYWNHSLPEGLAARLEPSCRPPRPAAASSLQTTDLYQYLEAMPAARLRLPDAVHFLIGSFPALFGSELGTKLRNWCVQRGWILLWSLGLNLGPNAYVQYWTIGYMSHLPSHARLIDPLTLTHAAVSNLSASAVVARAFDASWATAAATRSSAHPHRDVTNATWLAIWSNLSVEMPPSLHVRPVRAGSCAEPDLCIGVAEAEKGAAEQPCVCYDKEAEAAVAGEKTVEAAKAADAVGAAEPEVVARAAGAEVQAVEVEDGTVQAVAKRPHPLLPLHTVSGFSSGGDMAMIHLVAYSSATRGATVVGGAPYGCNLLPNSNRFPAGKQTCQFPPKNEDWPAHIRRMDRYLDRHAKESLIDPTSYLLGTRVVLFSSSDDTVVLQPVMRAAATQLSSYMSSGGNLKPVFSVPCQHSWPTDDPKMDAASHDGVPFINDCHYDLAGISFRHMLNRSLSPRVAAKERHLYKVSQRSFIPRGTIVIDGTEMNTVVASQLDDTALLYVPLSCAKTDADGPPCAIHVHYHGCTLEYPNWSAMHLGLHDWAEANNIMVLHPRVRWIYSGPLANYGCWDWEGATGAGFDTHEGLQLRTVINMLEAIGRLGGAQFVQRYPATAGDALVEA